MVDSSDRGQEFTGKTVDEAVAEGLATLGLAREQAEIDVINKGSRGIFGLGSEAAVVRIRPIVKKTPKPAAAAEQPATGQPPKPATRPSLQDGSTQAEAPTAPANASSAQASSIASTESQPASETSTQETTAKDDETDTDEGAVDEIATDEESLKALASELLEGLLDRMGFEAEITAAWLDDEENDRDHDSRYLRLDISGNDVSALIGRRGETLASLQYLVRLMVNQRIKQWKNIVVDVESYKERRVTQLTQLAHRMADQVTDSGRAVSLEPMPPNERRIVHLALRDHETVYTQSSGEGDRRKVHIVARADE